MSTSPSPDHASATLPVPEAPPPVGRADDFAPRHLGVDAETAGAMATELGYASLDQLVDTVVPADIRLSGGLDLPVDTGEFQAIKDLREVSLRNRVCRSYIGMGYAASVTPPVIQRNILENPGWYTAYTPYQAEIAQGRLEACLNFQTMITGLTALDVANASLLDEATAAAEAMAMCLGARRGSRGFFVSGECHPQTIDVLRARAEPLGVEIVVGDWRTADPAGVEGFAGALLQYPATDGAVHDYGPFVERVHAAGGLAVVAADIMSLVLLRPPGEFGADIAVGSTQRFGLPLGFGGPHAAFIASTDKLKRRLPGRIVGVSKDADGNPAFRLSLQTREQHIRREKATSNICTAQVLPAVLASMFAVYHGPDGLRAIAGRIHACTLALADALQSLGRQVAEGPVFDTLKVELAGESRADVLSRAAAAGINFRKLGESTIGITLDETVTPGDCADILEVFGGTGDATRINVPGEAGGSRIPNPHARTSGFLTHPVFHSCRTETEMLRYIHRLEARDLTLNTSMIPLGSCTMKLNGTSEMLPLSWPEFADLHPFAPGDQAEGYAGLFADLERWLAEITGFAAVSLQPNAGSQGEFAGLLAIWRYHRSRGDADRKVCLIPASAHGTNPASAVMAGFEVVPVPCEDNGNIDVSALTELCEQHAARLGALMITYPSTHGVFEASIREVCRLVHDHGGQVYMDGANMNAQVGLCSPGDIGADVCHLNLHKTFCIPHGGGGPGVGPIGVAGHLEPFLPGHAVTPTGRGLGDRGAVSAAGWGSPLILPISWMYIRMMGARGLIESSRIAILNANYIAHRLSPFFPVLYTGNKGLVAHECILDFRQWKDGAGIDVEDIAKRLMDYGFHAPTMSWPVAGTMMVEPTESESREELDRFCDAMIAIHGELTAIRDGDADGEDNLLKNAPHTAAAVTGDDWPHPYSRQSAAYPAPWTREHKYWPPVGRIDNVFGDRNLVCTCQGMEAFVEGR